ncbi:MAG: hypothetical protein K6A44_03040 [bacterium]|nr:hypothetical protein [bacterium]
MGIMKIDDEGLKIWNKNAFYDIVGGTILFKDIILVQGLPNLKKLTE